MGMSIGFTAGISFAVILSIAERRKTLDQLSLRRVALWGGIGGMALMLFAMALKIGAGESQFGQVLTFYLPVLVFNGLIGAGFASVSVALARQAEAKLTEGDDSRLMLED